MIQAKDATTLRDAIHSWRDDAETIVLVPTMGNLHRGHLALVEAAKKHGDRIVVSIFVNPTQFVQGEDFADYPRTLTDDLNSLTAAGIDLVYLPDTDNLYPGGDQAGLQVTVPALDGRFCGASRPGHFTGVATVVTKLFNLVQPDKAIFGEKDFQQLLVIEKLVRDLHLPIQIVAHPTVREADGLALSSRNRYLNQAERKLAPNLYQVMTDTAAEIAAGNHDFASLEQKASENLKAVGFEVDYFAIVSAHDLGAWQSGPGVILAAVWLGKARLIDNLRLSG